MSEEEKQLAGERSSSWLEVCGETDSALAEQVASSMEERLREENYTADDLYYLKHLDTRLVKGELALDDAELERLRAMCQLWEVKLVPREITSHRPLIGPLIVALKKLLYPLLGALLKETLKQQQRFNASVISYLANQKRQE